MEYHPPLHLGVVTIEKGAFGSASTKVANFTFMGTKMLTMYAILNLLYLEKTIFMEY